MFQDVLKFTEPGRVGTGLLCRVLAVTAGVHEPFLTLASNTLCCWPACLCREYPSPASFLPPWWPLWASVSIIRMDSLRCAEGRTPLLRRLILNDQLLCSLSSFPWCPPLLPPAFLSQPSFFGPILHTSKPWAQRSPERTAKGPQAALSCEKVLRILQRVYPVSQVSWRCESTKLECASFSGVL